MSKKFSIIINKIDTKKIIEEVAKYILANNNTKPYIFINKDTIDKLISQIGYDSKGLMGSQSDYLCGYFSGCKVFCDNTLSFGEIEIR